MESRYGPTHFRDYTHAQLAEMLAAGKPGSVKAVADDWRDIARWLDDVASSLDQQHARFQGLWEGPAQQAHAEMATALVAGARQVAWTARRISDQVSTVAEALGKAQQRMAALGSPASLLSPDQAVLAAASAPLPYGAARREAAARQAKAIKTIQEYQRGKAAADARSVAAAQILEELRDAYRNVDLPAVPVTADPPTLAADGSPVFPPAP